MNGRHDPARMLRHLRRGHPPVVLTFTERDIVAMGQGWLESRWGRLIGILEDKGSGLEFTCLRDPATSVVRVKIQTK